MPPSFPPELDKKINTPTCLILWMGKRVLLTYLLQDFPSMRCYMLSRDDNTGWCYDKYCSGNNRLHHDIVNYGFLSSFKLVGIIPYVCWLHRSNQCRWSKYTCEDTEFLNLRSFGILLLFSIGFSL